MTVHLVGAGPGDPELLTRRAERLLRTADVVVHDRLVSQEILDLVHPLAELIDVGKTPGQVMPQELINSLLVTLGTERESGCVVRLKGGDPLVFGRGGEEAIALQAAGVSFTIVPGISSAFAVPLSGGVPVTHRGVATHVTVVTGHQDAESQSRVDWSALAAVGGTLVILMGVHERGKIASALMKGGLVASTPVAIVRHGTRADQSDVRCRLDELALVEAIAPSILVIGDVAAFDLRSSSQLYSESASEPHTLTSAV